MHEGVPGMGLKVDGTRYFWYHHTAADTFDKVDLDEFNRCVATMAVMAYVVADMDQRSSDSYFIVCLPTVDNFKLWLIMKHFSLFNIIFKHRPFQSALQNASVHSNEMNRSVEPDLCGSPWKENRSECQLYPEIFTEEQMAAQLKKMRTCILRYQRMLMPKALNKTYKIGMTEKFWVNVDDGNGGSKSEQITAQLLAKGTRNAIWADINQINENNNINNDSAIEYLEFLEQKTPPTSVDSTKGSWELVTTYFGNEPNFDGDNITDYLFADIYSGAAGYFSPSDLTVRGSNQRDILYIDCNISNSYAKTP